MYYFLDSLMFLWTESSFYPGGERGDIIDLVVQRDKLSGLPIVRGSSIKGAIRSFFELEFGEALTNRLFGSSERVSPIIFSDAHLLMLPIRELFRTFVYMTGRFPLQNLLSILELFSSDGFYIKDIIENLINSGNDPISCLFSTYDGERHDLYLMDGSMRLSCRSSRDFAKFIDYLAKVSLPKMGSSVIASYKFIENVMRNYTVFLNDDAMFKEYVDMGLERLTRIGLDYERKVVKSGHLFMQEVIPRYTLFFSAVFKSKRNLKAVNEFYHHFFGERKFTVINLGGDESIGRGIVRLVLYRF